MPRNPVVGDEVRRLWRRHRLTPFPDRLRGQPVAGVDLAALDAEVAGCVDAWHGGRLDDEQRGALRRAVSSLDAVVPLLPSRVEAIYFTRLHRVALVVLDG